MKRAVLTSAIIMTAGGALSRITDDPGALTAGVIATLVIISSELWNG